MVGYLYAINEALKYASIRMKWYEETGDVSYLVEATDWISVANIYGKEIKRNEDCEIVDRISLG
jgi:hypothetical protein